MNLTAYSLFSGIGGFDLGFARAGIDIIGQCEVEPHCQEVLGKQFPGIALVPDVCEVDSVEADIICGGFPCQDVSVAGNRAGLAGERSGLWFEFARILQRSRPRWVVIENVPGLLSSNRGRDMGTILGTLGNLGYGFAYRVLDAQWFGVPQRRQRLFIVGCLGDPRRAVQVLLEPESGCGDPDAFAATRQEAAGAVAAGAGDARSGLLADTGVVSALSARMGTSGHGDVANAQAGWLLPFRKMARASSSDDFETWEEAEYANTLDANGNVTRTAHAVIGLAFNQRDEPRMSETGYAIQARPGSDEQLVAYSVYPESGQGADLRAREIDLAPALSATDGKMHERGARIVTGTLEARGSHGFLDADSAAAGMLQPAGLSVRRLMPIECERLQGFPDNWTEGHADTHRYRMLGNAVAVPVVEWIARRIVATESGGSP